MFFALTAFASVSARAEEYDLSGIYDSLSDEVKNDMSKLGADSADVNSLGQISLDSVVSQLANTAQSQSAAPTQSSALRLTM